MREKHFKPVTDESLSEVIAYCRVLSARGYDVAVSYSGITATTKDAKEKWMNR